MWICVHDTSIYTILPHIDTSLGAVVSYVVRMGVVVGATVVITSENNNKLWNNMLVKEHCVVSHLYT